MSTVEQRTCTQCGAPAEGNLVSCKFCGAELPRVAPPQPPQQQQTAYAYQQPAQPQYAPQANPSGKSKTTAGLLGILLGGVGAHKFYLGRPGMGILYLIFVWTYIPAIVGLIEGIIYLTASDEDFYRKYVVK